jgi:hypothetical protein
VHIYILNLSCAQLLPVSTVDFIYSILYLYHVNPFTATTQLFGSQALKVHVLCRGNFRRPHLLAFSIVTSTTTTTATATATTTTTRRIFPSSYLDRLWGHPILLSHEYQELFPQVKVAGELS